MVVFNLREVHPRQRKSRTCFKQPRDRFASTTSRLARAEEKSAPTWIPRLYVRVQVQRCKTLALSHPSRALVQQTDILASTPSLPARVAKLADARDLKSYLCIELVTYIPENNNFIDIISSSVHIFEFSRRFERGTKMPEQNTMVGGKVYVYKCPNSSLWAVLKLFRWRESSHSYP